MSVALTAETRVGTMCEKSEIILSTSDPQALPSMPWLTSPPLLASQEYLCLTHPVLVNPRQVYGVACIKYVSTTREGKSHQVENVRTVVARVHLVYMKVCAKTHI